MKCNKTAMQYRGSVLGKSWCQHVSTGMLEAYALPNIGYVPNHLLRTSAKPDNHGVIGFDWESIAQSSSMEQSILLNP